MTLEELTRSNHRRRLVNLRWKEYLPGLTILARVHAYPDLKLKEWHQTFYLRLRELFSAGVRWPAIRAGRMDDPVVREEAFSAALAQFRERSARFGPHTGSHEGKDYEKRYARDKEMRI